MADLPRPPVSLSQDFADSKPNISIMAQQFMVSRDTQAHDKAIQERFDQKQDEIKLRSGDLTSDQISRIVNVPRSILAAQSEKKRHSKDTQDQLIFMNLLDDMRDRLADLEQRMDEQLDKLRSKYGGDVASGMAETFLTDEESAGLVTDEDKLKALADKFLDENGATKDEYKHLDEAQYIRDWNEAQQLEKVVAKYEGRSYLTESEQNEVLEAAEKTSLVDNKAKITGSNNDKLQETVDTAIDNGRKTLGEFNNTTNLGFR